MNCKKLTKKANKRGSVKLPVAVLEECNLNNGTGIDVLYGKNYSCVVIMPANQKIGEIQAKRISGLVNEPLSMER